ncbi:MAG: hypothetical protein WA982_13300 [Rubrobacteraceae bacterium]
MSTPAQPQGPPGAATRQEERLQFHRGSRQLRCHVANCLLAVHNFVKHLKALGWRTLYETMIVP